MNNCRCESTEQYCTSLPVLSQACWGGGERVWYNHAYCWCMLRYPKNVSGSNTIVPCPHASAEYRPTPTLGSISCRTTVYWTHIFLSGRDYHSKPCTITSLVLKCGIRLVLWLFGQLFFDLTLIIWSILLINQPFELWCQCATVKY